MLLPDNRGQRLLSRNHRLSNQTPSSRHRLLESHGWSHTVSGSHTDAPQTLRVTAAAVGYSPHLDGKRIIEKSVLSSQQTWRTQAGTPLEALFQLGFFYGVGCAVSATEGENSWSYPAVNSADRTKD